MSPQALRDLAGAVGAAHVDASPGAVRAASTATFATAQRAGAVVRPADRAEVEACVRVARAHGLVLHAVSRGRNWGYGSRVPRHDGAVLLSLERMNGIVGFDPDLACATIEPGVSFRQLSAFLAARGADLQCNPPGSTSEASVVGHALERGVAAGPSPQAWSRIASLEVVLPDGACIRTGAAATAGGRAGDVHRWGAGPVLDGLFSQSSLGIVTRATVWLDVVPRFHQHLHFSAQADAALEPLVEALARLRREGTVTTSASLHNAAKILTVTGRFPLARTRGTTPLPAALRDEMVRALPGGGGAWFGEAAVHAPVPAALDALRARAAEVLAEAGAEVRWSGVNAPGPFFGGGGGEGIAQAYWRKAGPVPPDPDPDRDRCGVIWHSPALPFRPGDARAAVDIAVSVLEERGFEPAVTLTAMSARCLYAVTSILYDRAVPGEDARAARCHAALAGALASAGYHPYRMSLLDADLPVPPDAVSGLIRTLRGAIDPDGILAPGRHGGT